MRYFVVKNSGSKFGFDFIVKNDENEIEKRVEFTSKTTDGYLRIPQEYWEILGKKLIRMSILVDDEIEIEKGKKVEISSINQNHKMSEIDFAKKYLSDEEFELYQKLKKKIAINMELMKKKEAMERAQKEYEEMLSKLGE